MAGPSLRHRGNVYLRHEHDHPDSDDDGMEDGWEAFYTLRNPITGKPTIDPNRADAFENPDGDGYDDYPPNGDPEWGHDTAQGKWDNGWRRQPYEHRGVHRRLLDGRVPGPKARDRQSDHRDARGLPPRVEVRARGSSLTKIPSGRIMNFTTRTETPP